MPVEIGPGAQGPAALAYGAGQRGRDRLKQIIGGAHEQQEGERPGRVGSGDAPGGGDGGRCSQTGRRGRGAEGVRQRDGVPGQGHDGPLQAPLAQGGMGRDYEQRRREDRVCRRGDRGGERPTPRDRRRGHQDSQRDDRDRPGGRREEDPGDKGGRGEVAHPWLPAREPPDGAHGAHGARGERARPDARRGHTPGRVAKDGRRGKRGREGCVAQGNDHRERTGQDERVARPRRRVRGSRQRPLQIDGVGRRRRAGGRASYLVHMYYIDQYPARHNTHSR